ncbi:hypothetical protein [Nocardioides alcanivorans]|uniref:hypothetical protein n=1 Tax=Nocardioides alcanivorans TaxID=2897352 RepID=UPI001F19B7A9|nr:hypothetical protein [Nocardioides alcanivorans]
MLDVIDAAQRLRRAADVPGPIAPLRVAAGYVDTSGLATGALFALLGGDHEGTPPSRSSLSTTPRSPRRC